MGVISKQTEQIDIRRMKLELDLLDNGLDFIIEGLKPTTKIWGDNVSDVKWKYSVLNIFSGIELILKEKLKREHWSLIFQDVSSANQRKLIEGDFISVAHSDVIKRLKEICNISINDKPIDTLRKLRNKFEHFEIAITIEECKSVIALALKEVIEFIDNHIASVANENQLKKINHIKNMTFEFDSFITNQLKGFENAIKGILDNNSGKVVHCLNCNNESLVIFRDSKKENRCFVCDEIQSKEDFLEKMRETENDNKQFSFIEFEEYNYRCENCNSKSRVRYKPSYFSTSNEYRSDYFICINCLYYQTSSDIFSEELKKEITELEKTHTNEEIIEILKQRIE